MESNSDRAAAAEALKQAERAAAAPYVDYPPTPRWYPAAVALWTAAFGWVITLPTDTAYKPIGMIVLVAAELGFIFWYRRYRGVWPIGRAPQEVGKVMKGFIVGAVVVIGAIALTFWLGPRWLGVLVGAVLVFGSLTWYEHLYAKAAERDKERLA